ncbi:MAG: hypothetical protein RI967_2521 [Planctomycetota bacterium]
MEWRRRAVATGDASAGWRNREWYDRRALDAPADIAREATAWYAEPTVAAVLALGMALGVGLLVGFERERQPDTVAGVRTFGFAGLLGGLVGHVFPPGAAAWATLALAVAMGLATAAGGMIAARMRAIGATAGAAGSTARSAADSKADSTADSSAAPTTRGTARDPNDVGLTTAFALMATVFLGHLAVAGERALVVVGAGVLFLLLYIREPLHRTIRGLSKDDVRAIATFVLIALVILPVLPDTAVGPFEAIRPRTAWLMVVLVVSISLAGYLVQVVLGDRAGVLAAGLLGGLVSSTAVTAGASRRARGEGLARSSAAMVLLACGVLSARAIALVAFLSPATLRLVAVPLALAGVIAVVSGLRLVRRDAAARTAPLPRPENPTQLGSAVAFAGLFVAVRLGSRAAAAFAGPVAFLAVAAASGVTDMDAIALSAAREVGEGVVTPTLGAQAVLVAFAVNTAVKAGFTRVWGTPRLFAMIAWPMGIGVAAALTGVVALGLIGYAGVASSGG